MKRKERIQEKFDKKLIEKLEKTRLWRVTIKNVERFEKQEKEFFLNRVRQHYSKKERVIARWYTDLIATIATNYQPAEEAKRIRLLILIVSI